MANKPEYLSEFYEREGTRESRSLHKALNTVQKTGLRNLTRQELKQIGLPIIREARKRMRLLEAEGLTDSPAYKFISEKGIPSTGGKNTNAIKASVRIAFDFLHAKTSLVEGAREYNTWLDEHLGTETTAEEREELWSIIHWFENNLPGHFTGYGYDESIKKISQAAKATGTSLYTLSQFGEGELSEDDRLMVERVNKYLSMRDEVSVDKLREYLTATMDKEAEDMLFGKKLGEEGRSAWFKGRNSIKGF